MLTVVQFLLFSLLLNVGYASSVCMADCSSQLTQGPPSLYEKYCCNTENSGRTFKLSENNKINFILCPSNLPTSCQRFVRSPNNCSEIFRMNTSAVSGYYAFGGSSVYCDIVDYINGLNFSDCYEIFQKRSFTPSGYYTIQAPNGSLISVYCDMEGSNCDGKGGWMRVGYLNTTKPNATCPPGLTIKQYNNTGYSLCGRPVSSFGSQTSVFFSTYGDSYNKVCGQVRGYQFGSPDAFLPYNSNPNIDAIYVDGISITYDSNPRKHIWTYACGAFADGANRWSCTCNNGSTGTTVPSFVGNSYYCESGNPAVNTFINALYSNDTLWDGQHCGILEQPCCIYPKMPWFTKTLNETTSQDIELRMMANERTNDEDTPVYVIELFTR